MTDAERFELALRVIQHNLIGQGFDALKPMSASSCSQLAQYIDHILEGKTPEEAGQLMS